MDLQNSFVVPSDIETAWKTLQDVEGLAPCMPGATLTSPTGDLTLRTRGAIMVETGASIVVIALSGRYHNFR